MGLPLHLPHYSSRPPRTGWILVSDNGTNFLGAAKELQECICSWNQEHITQHLAQKEIQWKFNTPSAPHFGGVWERLIRSTKTILRTILGTQCVGSDTLNTLLTEVEAILNSRPLSQSVKTQTILRPSRQTTSFWVVQVQASLLVSSSILICAAASVGDRPKSWLTTFGVASCANICHELRQGPSGTRRHVPFKKTTWFLS